MIWIPTIEDIEEIYKRRLKMAVSYENKGAIESALDQIAWGTPGNPEKPTIWSQAALLIRNLIQFHVFMDGNKRIGIMSVFVFLYKNGWNLHPADPEDIFSIPMQIAMGNLSLAEISYWLEKNSMQIEE